MAIGKLSGVAGPGPAPSPPGGKETFGKILEDKKAERTPPLPAVEPARVQPHQVAATKVEHAQKAEQVIDRVCAAQHRLDQILQLAQSGKTFTSAELLAMQAQVYRASQEIDLAGKVVEKATSGVKQVLQTQL